MDRQNFLAETFEANRMHLRAVAYRMLGSRSEAEDAVQEAWLRLSRADTHDVHNFGGWLTTVTARVCLDMLRARKSRREEPMGPHVPEPAVNLENIEREAQPADSVGAALLVVLETLAPAERLGALVERYEASARVGAARLPFRARWAVLSAANIYGGIARKVVARGPHAWDTRTVVHKPEKIVLVANALMECGDRPAPVDRTWLWTRPR